MHAVEPALVRAAERLSVTEIADRLDQLDGMPRWVTLSGGNPALHHLGPLVTTLREHYCVAVETQGSVWRPWLATVDRLTISPKPPSSGMVSDSHTQSLDRFMRDAETLHGSILKIVCFDVADLVWAKQTALRYPSLPLYLSAGTPVPTPADIRATVGETYRWLCEAVAHDPELNHARVLPQLHVIAWKDAKGV